MGQMADVAGTGEEGEKIVIIIEVAGGLGNQMFQYALYTKFLSMGKEAKLDIFSYRNKDSMPFELDIFHLKYETDTEFARSLYVNERMRKITNKWRNLSGKEGRTVYNEKLDVGYQPEILNMDEVYLSGYWQCEKYFLDMKEEIRKQFCFPKPQKKECLEMERRILETPSTAIHIRRGDYLLPENDAKYGGICTINYYRKAMAYIRSLNPKTEFYIFTNDYEWTRENICEENATIVTCNTGKDSFYDMYLMSLCQNNIIANSSFSWWAAWLNRHENKKVVSPHRWFKHLDVSDAICEDWIRIEG